MVSITQKFHKPSFTTTTTTTATPTTINTTFFIFLFSIFTTNNIIINAAASASNPTFINFISKKKKNDKIILLLNNTNKNSKTMKRRIIRDNVMIIKNTHYGIWSNLKDNVKKSGFDTNNVYYKPRKCRENLLQRMSSSSSSSCQRRGYSYSSSFITPLLSKQKPMLISLSSSSSSSLVVVSPQFSFLQKPTIRTKVTMSSVNDGDETHDGTTKKVRRVAIVGGGLAGLSVAYQLLEKTTTTTTTTKEEEEGERISITVLDKTKVGMGGASSVAGGLLHPFSPRGKLVHLGHEGLKSTLRLLSIANSDNNNNINDQTTTTTPTPLESCILKPFLYRIATTENHVTQLKQSAELYPEYCTWLDCDDLIDQCYPSFSKEEEEEKEEERKKLRKKWKGGLKITSGKVIHVPTYLKGLWNACLHLSSSSSSKHTTKKEEEEEDGMMENTTAKWIVLENEEIEKIWRKKLVDDFDTIVFAAGAGLFMSSSSSSSSSLSGEGECKGILSGRGGEKAEEENEKEFTGKWPVQLVGGQSIELSLPGLLLPPNQEQSELLSGSEALLCGKYISPLPSSLFPNDAKENDNNNDDDDDDNENGANMVLVGATHEYNTAKLLSKDEVIEELKSRSYDLAPWIWDKGTVRTITKGWRVQSNRGLFGRVPIVGRLSPPPSSFAKKEGEEEEEEDGENKILNHEDAWIFTGLSSRGLIHHGIYGDILSDAILKRSEEDMELKYDGIGWWRKAFDKDGDNK